MLSRLKYFTIVISWLVVSTLQQDIQLGCTDTCTVPINIPASQEPVKVTACLNHLVKVDVIPGEVDDPCVFSLVEPKEIDFDHIFYVSSDNSDSKTVYSLSNEVEIRGLDCGFSVNVSCAPNVTTTSLVYEYGSDSLHLDLSPNTRYTVTLEGSNIHNISLNSTLPSPLAGYTLVSLEDGDSYMVVGNFPRALLQPRDNVSKIEVVTFGESQEQGELAWELGDPPTTTSTTTTTTTTTTPQREEAFMFVLGVNEANFQNQYQDQIVNIINETIYSICDNETTPPIVELRMTSCRSACLMTNIPDRGCVKVAVDVSGIPPTAACRQEDISIIQYIRESLLSRLEELEDIFNASKVYVDSCNTIEISSSWVLTAIGIAVGCVFLAFSIFWVVSNKKSLLRRSKRKHHESKTNLVSDVDRDNHWETY